jgi:HK97 family phage major capsid protein
MSESQKTAHSSANVKALKLEGERMLRVIATSPTLDRDLEVIDTRSIRIPIKPRGWKYASDITESDEVDVPFLVDHEWALEKQAGSIQSMFINGDGELETVVKLSTVDNGERVYTLAKEGHLGNSFSIGYSLQNATLEEGVIKNIELTEFSAVFKGSNRDARLLEVKGVKEESTMAEAKEQTLKDKIAERDRLQSEIEAAEAEKEEKTEQVEQVAETPKDETEATTEQTDVAEEEDTKVNEETEQMSDQKAIAKEQVVAKAAPAQEVVKEEKMDKYDFTARQFVAWVTKDHKTLSELNKKALESYKNESGSKATYLNTGVTADGGAIVPSAELLRDVYSLLENYSTVSNDLRVITLTEGDSLDVATLLADVVVSEVETEGGDKPVTKPTFGDGNIALREFAGIAIITKKLVRQAAVNVYEILRESFARAIANQRAIMALTDPESGIIHKAGIVTTAGTGWDAIRRMPYQLPVAAVPGAKYYISREMLETLDTALDGEGRDLDIVELDGDGLSGRFKNGYRFSVEEILGADTTHAVFGNFSRYGILLRQGTVESETFDTGIVVDGSSVEHNLLQQNKLAHRVAFYENVGYPLPGAFAILTAESS